MTEKTPPALHPDEHRLIRSLVRYGIPVLMLIFYVNASLRFDYTPDSTFLSLLSLGTSVVPVH